MELLIQGYYVGFAAVVHFFPTEGILGEWIVGEANHVPFTALCTEAVEPIHARDKGVVNMNDADDFGHDLLGGIIAGVAELGISAPIEADIAGDKLLGEVRFAIYILF